MDSKLRDAQIVATLLVGVLFLAACEARDATKPASEIKVGMTEAAQRL